MREKVPEGGMRAAAGMAASRLGATALVCLEPKLTPQAPLIRPSAAFSREREKG